MSSSSISISSSCSGVSCSSAPSGPRLTIQSMTLQRRKRQRRGSGGTLGNGNSSSSSSSSFIVSFLGMCGLVVLVVVLCLQQLQNDDLFADMLLLNSGGTASTKTLSPLIGGWSKGSSFSAGAAVGEDEEDEFQEESSAREAQELTALVIAGADEDLGGEELVRQETVWHKVQVAFEKQDAVAQHKWWNTHGLVHVIHTRVLQNQPRLLDYTVARVQQFTTFTVPSIQHQTAHNEFLWILWTDPSLQQETEQWLNTAIGKGMRMTNVVVIGYKAQRPSIRSDWFHQTLDQTYILAGSYKLLMDYHKVAASSQKIILETYLDAEDALALNYVQRIQQQAAMALKEPHKSFKLWCPNQLVEWDYASPKWYQQQLLQQQQQQQQTTNSSSSSSTTSSNSIDEGYFTWKQSVDKCFATSAGSTIGYSAHVDEVRDFPMTVPLRKESRAKWHHTIMPCDDHIKESNCLGWISGVSILRSKTITAAASKNIAIHYPHPTTLAQQEQVLQQQQEQWQTLQGSFGIAPDSIRQFQQEFCQNLDKILLDVLTICLPNNACNPANKQALQDLLTTVGLKKKEPLSWSAIFPAVASKTKEEEIIITTDTNTQTTPSDTKKDNDQAG